MLSLIYYKFKLLTSNSMQRYKIFWKICLGIDFCMCENHIFRKNLSFKFFDFLHHKGFFKILHHNFSIFCTRNRRQVRASSYFTRDRPKFPAPPNPAVLRASPGKAGLPRRAQVGERAAANRRTGPLFLIPLRNSSSPSTPISPARMANRI